MYSCHYKKRDTKTANKCPCVSVTHPLASCHVTRRMNTWTLRKSVNLSSIAAPVFGHLWVYLYEYICDIRAAVEHNLGGERKFSACRVVGRLVNPAGGGWDRPVWMTHAAECDRSLVPRAPDAKSATYGHVSFKCKCFSSVFPFAI